MPPRTYLVDTVVGLALSAASLVLGYDFFVTGQKRPVSPLLRLDTSGASWHRGVLIWWLFAAVCVAGLAVRHRWPVWALALTGAGFAGHVLLQQAKALPVDLSPLFALYTLANLSRRRWVPWVGVCGLATAVYASAAVSEWSLTHAVNAVKRSPVRVSLASTLYGAAAQMFSMELLVVLAFVLGAGAWSRREHLHALQQRAAALERERDQRAALAAAAERARITRELHDVVAHGLSMMVVQAQGAAAALARHPERAEVALRHVIGTGRACTAEMRRLLGVVRRDAAGGVDGVDAADGVEGAALAPQPGVGALPALVDQVRAAGTEVTLHLDGGPEPLPPGLDLCAYRIVQEALTNVVRHAGTGARAAVRLEFGADRLEVEVTDDGAPTESIMDGGNGLSGIAERVALFGGTCTAGPRPGGGFGVHAVLPLEPAAPVPVGAP